MAIFNNNNKIIAGAKDKIYIDHHDRQQPSH